MRKGRLIGKISGTALVFLTLCLLPGGLAPAVANCVAAADGVVTFPDPNLEAAIREAIGKPAGDILQSDLDGLTTLYAQARNIVNIAGLEHCGSLTYLYLWGNQISDISAVSELSSLTCLYLGGNQISDMSAVSELSSLTCLALWGNQISDMSAVSELSSLTSLDLGGNQISDMSAVSELSSLTELYLENNQISDISPLAGLTGLVALYLDYNQIGDIGPISALTQLGETTWLQQREGIPICLGLRNNQVADISPLVANAGLASGDGIDLRGNPLSDESHSIHIPALEGRGVNVLYDTPTIAVNPTVFDFSATEGGANPADQTLEVWNSGSGTLNWSASDNAAWLNLSSETGSSTGPADVDEVTVSVDISGMTAGGYNATITISAEGAANSPQTVPVNLTVNPAGAGIAWDFPATSDVFLGPTPANNRPYLDAAVSLPAGTEPAQLSGVYWLDEATGDWQYFIPGFAFNTLTSLEPGQAYLVAVSGTCSWQLA